VLWVRFFYGEASKAQLEKSGFSGWLCR
jgi:hypothetical protein